MRPFVAYRSRTPGKKWDVYVPSTVDGAPPRRVSYGAAGMSDFTRHRDRARRARYRARHRRDRIDDPYSPGFWSWWHLWGDTSDGPTAFRRAVARARRILRRRAR
jgi:hypothetical protein